MRNKRHKLTYWVAHCLNDSPAYSIRRRTRREVVAELSENPPASPDDYSKPCKVVVEYADAFDLVCNCLSEGGLLEEGGSRSGSHYHEGEEE